MKTPILFLLVAVSRSFSYNKVGANGSCPVLDDEVCGTDNITYQNECFMRQKGVAKAYDGWCLNGQNPAAPASNNPSMVIPAPSQFSPISGSPPPPPEHHIQTAVGGSQLIITAWWRNEHNGYLAVGERYTGCPCNDSLLPVCGGNGLTYANMCRAECANVKAVKYGECGDYNYVWPGPTSCVCSFEIDTSNAVCGVNNRTYENQCVAKCVDTPVKGGGFCRNKCNCDHYFKPVCGRDGATYDNACKLDCLGISMLHEGICSKEAIDQCYFCKGSIKRVCGNDGQTYDNECFMKCRGAEKASSGRCPRKKGEKCHCLDVELPVCGIDEVTYKNACELECKGIPKLANKACYLYKRDRNNCKNKCRDQRYEPVCGRDGKTYNNSCDAGCGGTSILTNGPCGSAKNTTHCVCSDEPMPVCGVDGRDYINKCALECAGVSLAWEGPCNMHQSQSGALYKTGQISGGGPVSRKTGQTMFTPMPPPSSIPMIPAVPPAMPAMPPAHAPSMNISQNTSIGLNSIAPSFQEIKQIIDIKLAQHSQKSSSQNIIVLPPIQQTPIKKEPLEINLQFVNPDGTKTDINNQNVFKHVLGKKDFVPERPGDHDPLRMRLKMDKNTSLEKLYTMISLNPQSFYSYFTKLMDKGVVTRQSIMFKGLTLGKLMDFIEQQYDIGSAQIMVGSLRK